VSESYVLLVERLLMRLLFSFANWSWLRVMHGVINELVLLCDFLPLGRFSCSPASGSLLILNERLGSIEATGTSEDKYIYNLSEAHENC
jgi:hypothetical protein